MTLGDIKFYVNHAVVRFEDLSNLNAAWQQQQRRSTQVVTRPQTAGSVGSGGRSDGLGVCCAASRAFDLASSVFAAEQESSAAADSESSCTGTESLLAVSVELLARATASPETPSKEQVLSRSPTVLQHAQLESHYHCTARSTAEMRLREFTVLPDTCMLVW